MAPAWLRHFEDAYYRVRRGTKLKLYACCRMLNTTPPAANTPTASSSTSGGARTGIAPANSDPAKDWVPYSEQTQAQAQAQTPPQTQPHLQAHTPSPVGAAVQKGRFAVTASRVSSV